MTEPIRYNYLTLAQTELLNDWGAAVRDMFRGRIAFQIQQQTAVDSEFPKSLRNPIGLRRGTQ